MFRNARFCTRFAPPPVHTCCNLCWRPAFVWLGTRLLQHPNTEVRVLRAYKDAAAIIINAYCTHFWHWPLHQKHMLAATMGPPTPHPWLHSAASGFPRNKLLLRRSPQRQPPRRGQLAGPAWRPPAGAWKSTSQEQGTPYTNSACTQCCWNTAQLA